MEDSRRKAVANKFYKEAGDLSEVFIVEEKSHEPGENIAGGDQQPTAGTSGYQTHNPTEVKENYLGHGEPLHGYFKYDTSASSETSESEAMDDEEGDKSKRKGKTVRLAEIDKKCKKSRESGYEKESYSFWDMEKSSIAGGDHQPTAGTSGYQTHNPTEVKENYLGHGEPLHGYFKYDTSASSETSESEAMDDEEGDKSKRRGRKERETETEKKRENVTDNQDKKEQFAENEKPRTEKKTRRKKDEGQEVIEVKWNTWDLADKHKANHQVYLSLALRDFLIYLFALAAITTVVLGSLNFTMYLYSFILSDVLTKSYFEAENNIQTNFRQLRTIDQFWTFLFEIYLETIVCRRASVYGKKIKLTTSGDLLLVFENLIIGVPRIRQVRVGPASCKIPIVFEEIFDRCYDYYNYYSESKEPFGPKSGSEWTFTDGIAAVYNGRVSQYLEGGFYFNFSRDCYETRQTLLTMKDKAWIDQGTRAVFLDFSVYSPNVNLFCTSKLVAEFPPSGGVITRSHFKTLKLIRYVTIWEYLLLSVECLVALFLLYYTFQEIRKMLMFRWTYPCHFWNIIDFIIIGLGWTVAAVHAVRYSAVSVLLPGVVKTMKTDGHGNLDELSEIQESLDIVIGFLVAIMWIKLLKYLMLSKTIYHVLSTISKVITELVGLALILFILLISFALFGHLLYGSQVEEFGSLTSSIISLALLIIGALDYEKILNIRPIIGAIFFILFIFLYVLVFLSLLIAILVNGFTAMRYEIIEDQERVFAKDIFYKFLYYILRCLKMTHAADTINNKLEADKVKQDYVVLVEILRRSGFRGREIRLFLEKHDVHEGEPISDEKMQKIYKEIDTKGQLYMEAIEHEQIMSQVDVLKIRMNYVDKMTEEMAAKVELLLDKIINREQK